MSRGPVFPDCGDDSAVPPSLPTIQLLVQSGATVLGPLQSMLLLSGVDQPAWLTGGVVQPTWLKDEDQSLPGCVLAGQSAWVDFGGWDQFGFGLVLGRLGMETIDKILALQTPLQQITVGSGRKLSTHT